jgi:hypothetical protein
METKREIIENFINYYTSHEETRFSLRASLEDYLVSEEENGYE